MKKYLPLRAALPVLLLLTLILFPFSCAKEEPDLPSDNSATPDFAPDMLLEWFDLSLELIKKTNGFSPPVAARALGYMGITSYESVVGGMPGYQTLAGQLSDLPAGALPEPFETRRYFWPLAANAALSVVTEALFFNAASSDKFAMSALFFKYDNQYRSETTPEVYQNSVNFGRLLGAAIAGWASRDPIGHQAQLKNFPDNYIPPLGPEKWAPTGSQVIPLQPYWGNARTFVPNCAALTQPPEPIPFSTFDNSPFYAQAFRVFAVSRMLSAEERRIAEYWGDGAGTITPPGHSVAIALQLIRQEQLDLGAAALLLARMGIAVNDAFVSCWRCKFFFNVLRPETYIKRYIDAQWKPLLPTPPFPEYTSGHSTQSGAAAIVLSETFGYNYAFTDAAHTERTDIDGAPRRFTNFMQAAEEAMNSRLYGGIHYPMGNERGLNQGLAVGREAMALKFKE